MKPRFWIGWGIFVLAPLSSLSTELEIKTIVNEENGVYTMLLGNSNPGHLWHPSSPWLFRGSLSSTTTLLSQNLLTHNPLRRWSTFSFPRKIKVKGVYSRQYTLKSNSPLLPRTLVKEERPVFVGTVILSPTRSHGFILEKTKAGKTGPAFGIRGTVVSRWLHQCELSTVSSAQIDNVEKVWAAGTAVKNQSEKLFLSAFQRPLHKEQHSLDVAFAEKGSLTIKLENNGVPLQELDVHDIRYEAGWLSVSGTAQAKRQRGIFQFKVDSLGRNPSVTFNPLPNSILQAHSLFLDSNQPIVIANVDSYLKWTTVPTHNLHPIVFHQPFRSILKTPSNRANKIPVFYRPSTGVLSILARNLTSTLGIAELRANNMEMEQFLPIPEFITNQTHLAPPKRRPFWATCIWNLVFPSEST